MMKDERSETRDERVAMIISRLQEPDSPGTWYFRQDYQTSVALALAACLSFTPNHESGPFYSVAWSEVI